MLYFKVHADLIKFLGSHDVINIYSVWLYLLRKHIVGRYLCSTVVSHTLLPKGSVRENRKQSNDKIGIQQQASNKPLKIIQCTIYD